MADAEQAGVGGAERGHRPVVGPVGAVADLGVGDDEQRRAQRRVDDLVLEAEEVERLATARRRRRRRARRATSGPRRISSSPRAASSARSSVECAAGVEVEPQPTAGDVGHADRGAPGRRGRRGTPRVSIRWLSASMTRRAPDVSHAATLRRPPLGEAGHYARLTVRVGMLTREYPPVRVRRRRRPRRLPDPGAGAPDRRRRALPGRAPARRDGPLRGRSAPGRRQPGAADLRRRPGDGGRASRRATSSTPTPGTPTSPGTSPSCSTTCRTSSRRTRWSRSGRGRPSSSAVGTACRRGPSRRPTRPPTRSSPSARRRRSTCCDSYPALDPALRPRRPQRHRRRACTDPIAGDRRRRAARHRPARAVGRVRRADHPPEGRAAPAAGRPAVRRARPRSCCSPAPPTRPELAAETEAAVGRAARAARRRRLGHRDAAAVRRHPGPQPRHGVRLPVDLRAAGHRQPRGDGVRARRSSPATSAASPRSSSTA